MAFPVTLDPAAPAGSDSPRLGDDQIRALKQALADIFGLVVSPTSISATIGSVSSAGKFTLTNAAWTADAIGVAYGGTNLTSYTIGDIPYASGATTLSKLAAVAIGRALVSNGVSAAPVYSASPTLTAAIFTGTGSNAVQFASQKFSCFTIRVTNTAGTLQHAMVADSQTADPSSFIASVSGASNVLANTPSVNSGVDFTSGAGVNSANPLQFILNTGNFSAQANCAWVAVIENNETGTNYITETALMTLNVNGTTRTRCHIILRHATTGVATSWNTTTIASGKNIWIRVLGFIALAD